MLKSLYRLLASLRLAVTLIVVLAAVLAWSTILESRHGRELAQWYVYGAPWFLILLTALGVNILAATLLRLPWRRRQTGFVITRAGLLVLLAGSVQTFLAGIDGQVTLQQRHPVDHVLVTNRSRITALRQTDRGRVSSEFSFQPGAVDWPEDRQLDFGDTDGFGLKVVKFYRHAREQTEWVDDPIDYQGPVLDAYEKVLLDCMLGDHMLFWRQDGVEVCWSFLTPILWGCETCGNRSEMLHFYEAGSWGPEATRGLEMGLR